MTCRELPQRNSGTIKVIRSQRPAGKTDHPPDGLEEISAQKKPERLHLDNTGPY